MNYAVQKDDTAAYMNEPQLGSGTYDQPFYDEFPPQRRKLLEALGYLKSLEDWDEALGIRPKAAALTMTEHFISSLFLTKQHADYIQPDGEGGLALFWTSDSCELILTIDGANMHLSVDNKEGEVTFIEDIQFFGVTDPLPEEILQHIPRVNIYAKTAA